MLILLMSTRHEFHADPLIAWTAHISSVAMSTSAAPLVLIIKRVAILFLGDTMCLGLAGAGVGA